MIRIGSERALPNRTVLSCCTVLSRYTVLTTQRCYAAHADMQFSSSGETVRAMLWGPKFACRLPLAGSWFQSAPRL